MGRVKRMSWTGHDSKGQGRKFTSSWNNRKNSMIKVGPGMTHGMRQGRVVREAGPAPLPAAGVVNTGQQAGQSPKGSSKGSEDDSKRIWGDDSGEVWLKRNVAKRMWGDSGETWLKRADGKRMWGDSGEAWLKRGEKRMWGAKLADWLRGGAQFQFTVHDRQ